MRRDRPLVVAHRGASIDRPENTLDAVVLAREQGADRIEVDVHRTADGAIVVHHDDDLLRSAGDPRRIDASHADDLCSVPLVRFALRGDRAPTIPTLGAVVEAARPVPLLVEIKPVAIGPDRVVDAVIAALDAAGAGDESAIISFSDAITAHARARLGPDRAGPIRGSENGAESWRDLAASPSRLVVVSRRIASPDAVTQLANGGKSVFVYALDDTDSVRAYAAAGAAGIISNAPAIARAALES